jgi:hypothetical protein
MINVTGCGAKFSPSRGVLAGAARDLAAHPALGSRRGRLSQGRGRGRGQGRGFCSVAATAIVPGGIRQRHHRPDTGSHGPGPVLVRGMAWQLPAPRGRDKGCRRRPAATGPLSRLWPEGASRWATAWRRGARGTTTASQGVGCVCCDVGGGCGCGGGVSSQGI